MSLLYPPSESHGILKAGRDSQDHQPTLKSQKSHKQAPDPEKHQFLFKQPWKCAGGTRENVSSAPLAEIRNQSYYTDHSLISQRYLGTHLPLNQQSSIPKFFCRSRHQRNTVLWAACFTFNVCCLFWRTSKCTKTSKHTTVTKPLLLQFLCCHCFHRNSSPGCFGRGDRFSHFMLSAIRTQLHFISCTAIRVLPLVWQLFIPCNNN